MSTHGRTRIESLGPGQTVETGDQLSSAVLMGIALTGSTVFVLLNAIL